MSLTKESKTEDECGYVEDNVRQLELKYLGWSYLYDERIPEHRSFVFALSLSRH